MTPHALQPSITTMAAKRYYEVEFGVWVEEPDPLKAPACDEPWPDEWDHKHGVRPRCFRPEGHSGEHHEIRKVADGTGWVDYYWEEGGESRTEYREEQEKDDL